MTTDDPFDDPDAQEWARHVREDLVPKLSDSAMTVSLVPENVDVKFAVELGFSIMLDKPIVAVVQPGTRLPDRLVRVVDAIVEGAMDDPTTGERLQAAVDRILP